MIGAGRPDDFGPMAVTWLDAAYTHPMGKRGRSWDMKKSRYTEEQIAFALKQAETGGAAQGSGGA